MKAKIHHAKYSKEEHTKIAHNWISPQKRNKIECILRFSFSFEFASKKYWSTQ